MDGISFGNLTWQYLGTDKCKNMPSENPMGYRAVHCCWQEATVKMYTSRVLSDLQCRYTTYTQLLSDCWGSNTILRTKCRAALIHSSDYPKNQHRLSRTSMVRTKFTLSVYGVEFATTRKCFSRKWWSTNPVRGTRGSCFSPSLKQLRAKNQHQSLTYVRSAGKCNSCAFFFGHHSHPKRWKRATQNEKVVIKFRAEWSGEGLFSGLQTGQYP